MNHHKALDKPNSTARVRHAWLAFMLATIIAAVPAATACAAPGWGDVRGMVLMQTLLAEAPPAPYVTQPIPVNGGMTAWHEMDEFTVTLVGTKPPNAGYWFNTWVLAMTNDVPLPHSAVEQIMDDPNWNIRLPLQTNKRLKVSLICSNTFGLSTGTTTLYIDQIPEPLAVTAMGILLTCAALRQTTSREHTR